MAQIPVHCIALILISGNHHILIDNVTIDSVMKSGNHIYFVSIWQLFLKMFNLSEHVGVYNMFVLISYWYRISHILRWYMFLIQWVLCFLPPSLDEGVENTQRLRQKTYTIATHVRFCLSHVLPRLLLNPELFCKQYNFEPHTTLTTKRQQLYA